MSKFTNSLQANPVRTLAVMQATSEEDLTNYLKENLQTVVRARRFLDMHNGNADDSFMRGVTLGLAFGMAGAKDHMTIGHVAEDLKALVAVLTSKNINIFTGGELNEKTTDPTADSSGS